MSQQEFLPESQKTESSGEGQTAAWSPHTRKNRAIPKSEHPSTYDDTILEHSYASGYHAQAATNESSQEQTQTTNRRKTTREDTQSSKTRAHTYQVPWWARPQHHRLGLSKWLILLLICIFFVPIMLLVLKVLAVIFVSLLALMFIGIIIILALVIAGVVIVLQAIANIGKPRRRPGGLW